MPSRFNQIIKDKADNIVVVIIPPMAISASPSMAEARTKLIWAEGEANNTIITFSISPKETILVNLKSNKAISGKQNNFITVLIAIIRVLPLRCCRLVLAPIPSKARGRVIPLSIEIVLCKNSGRRTCKVENKIPVRHPIIKGLRKVLLIIFFNSTDLMLLLLKAITPSILFKGMTKATKILAKANPGSPKIKKHIGKPTITTLVRKLLDTNVPIAGRGKRSSLARGKLMINIRNMEASIINICFPLKTSEKSDCEIL